MDYLNKYTFTLDDGSTVTFKDRGKNELYKVCMWTKPVVIKSGAGRKRQPERIDNGEYGEYAFYLQEINRRTQGCRIISIEKYTEPIHYFIPRDK